MEDALMGDWLPHIQRNFDISEYDIYMTITPCAYDNRLYMESQLDL
eukprot:CAMPEP_0195516702 /NCGR_PEP_ID=MMETSP0794_2-20130614/8290_1 /TAXON_ID=515487 /ORGANISM="Stephanopyxis turris, Strain CCMP 815" /LENGTH=45 /DNA_ID= /DNA_START= /DNA_END= /DNA_ORIENTATION=